MVSATEFNPHRFDFHDAERQALIDELAEPSHFRVSGELGQDARLGTRLEWAATAHPRHHLVAVEGDPEQRGWSAAPVGLAVERDLDTMMAVPGPHAGRYASHTSGSSDGRYATNRRPELRSVKPAPYS